MKQRIYIDTSVIGGYYDEEFLVHTRGFFDRIINKEFEVYFSEIIQAELILAPNKVKEVVNLIPSDCFIYLELTDAAKLLAETYINEKALRKESLNDAYHIALTSVNKLDCLVSWNFKHIVNYDKFKLFNSINIKSGYSLIDIKTPLEFTKDENENEKKF